VPESRARKNVAPGAICHDAGKERNKFDDFYKGGMQTRNAVHGQGDLARKVLCSMAVEPNDISGGGDREWGRGCR